MTLLGRLRAMEPRSKATPIAVQRDRAACIDWVPSLAPSRGGGLERPYWVPSIAPSWGGGLERP